MPPLPLLPNRPAGQPDWYPSSGGYGAAPAAGGYATGPQGQQIPRATPEDPYAEVRWWNMHSEDLTTRALTEQNAFAKLQLQNQREDAQKALAQAMQIAQLTDQTSRYGTDVASRDRLAALEVNQEQFRANHQLAQGQQGIDFATAYGKFASSPDLMWAETDFNNAVQAVGAGGAPAPISGQPAPHAKNLNDFYALTGYGPTMGTAGAQGAGPGGGGSGDDLRLKAMKALGEAMPPSPTPGHDPNDFAAINAFKSLYFAGRPDTAAKLGPDRMKIGLAGLARSGYDPALLENERRSALPGQGRANSY